MTPLEMAKKKTAVKNCQNCEDIEIVNGVAYCRKSGKLIHPYLLNDTAKCPHEVKGGEMTEQEEREKVKWDAQEQRDYEAAVEMAEYCERYEPTYNADDGSM